MFARGGGTWKKATSAVQVSLRREKGCRLSTAENGSRSGRTGAGGSENHHPPSTEAKQKRESDRQFLISVLESSATKRDAKAYLQTFGSSPGSGPKKTPAFTTVLHDGLHGQNNVPRFVQGPVRVSVADISEVPHIAIVKLREPQSWDDVLLDGVAKTLTQLRDLGLRSVVVLDCDPGGSKGLQLQNVVSHQTDRIIKAIGRYGSPGAELVSSAIWKSNGAPQKPCSVGSTNLFVGFGKAFTTPLRHGHIVVVPPRALCEETLGYAAADANEIIFSLTKFFSGLQFNKETITEGKSANIGSDGGDGKKAVVDRIIVIDPFGGIPASSHGDGARVFVNLEEEFDKLQPALAAYAQPDLPTTTTGLSGNPKAKHAENLQLVKNTLAILPSTASAVITSPAEVANLRTAPTQLNAAHVGQFAGEVKTRRWQNPLIHNLLTDRPIYSASLPISRVKPSARSTEMTPARMPTTTLAKRGLPVTIFSSPRTGAWTPPTPGTPRLRLTDTCIDLPRLVHLINDSFDRKLDVEHYLRRVEDSLAGIIIAGEYEGGAILTWERPSGCMGGAGEEAAYHAGRLVPYLDKFAVLKKSQGAGGVADIVFNAMVRDCFPTGVCWRSRKDNPVNKWYFERSCGVRKLPDSNWAMFWTDPEAATSEQLMRDYEDVCRNVVPSWEDTKPAD
ncbi:mitochondrial amino-acid acetyltransferase [Chaetomidium leptoderma]|uniref:Amino-acid acetyltransferase, mitochondrial n=1 Tax=Chaetomidium leptoderma TaxID=669021 RepID=A0AAN6VQ97_9PEZI|nr:mitochondrial amino-acid acetyltransferase [Chaetomidium leptoderma]